QACRAELGSVPQLGAGGAALSMGSASMSPAQRQATQLGNCQMLAQGVVPNAPESSIAPWSAPDEHTSTLEHGTARMAVPPVPCYAPPPRSSGPPGSLPVRPCE